MHMLFSWNEKKRQRNLAIHGLDFKDARGVFDGLTFTFEDDRFDYPEHRFVTLGLLADTVVSIVHTETRGQIHVISFRRATRNETIIFFKRIQDQGTAEGQHENE